MDYNYHTHTYRCSHATGTEEEYIKRAIENGIKYMGFSDHIPFISPKTNKSSRYRVPVEQARDYCSDIAALKEKYKDKIQINIGFESEYYSDCFESMLEDARNWGAEYLILGQHFYEPEDAHSTHVASPISSVEALEKYADSLVEAMGKSVFTYIAHPDVFNFTGDRTVYKNIMRRICIASKKFGVPLEINFLGIRDGRTYPNCDFWQIAGDEGSPVTFGFDAHTAQHAFDGESLKVAMEMVKKYNLNYIGRPNIIYISKRKP